MRRYVMVIAYRRANGGDDSGIAGFGNISQELFDAGAVPSNVSGLRIS
jgi:hypothetical protein